MSIEIQQKEKDILSFRDRVISLADSKGILLRLIGGVAIRTHCPKYEYMHREFNRGLPDIDFAGYLKQVVQIQTLFLDLGFSEDKTVMRLFGTQRRIFDLTNPSIHVDIVLDKLHFCHDIPLKGRLEIDFPTIPLADLLLSKLQIVRLEAKDILDIYMLLLEHPLNNNDNEVVNISYIDKLCAKDWGLWNTVIKNLVFLSKSLNSYIRDKKKEKELYNKIQIIKNTINNSNKLLIWKLRSIFGESVKWYREVEELER